MPRHPVGNIHPGRRLQHSPGPATLKPRSTPCRFWTTTQSDNPPRSSGGPVDVRRGAAEAAKAVAEADAVAGVKDVTGRSLYDLACVCSVACAAVKDDAKLQGQYAARAVELLRQAVAKGY